MRGESRKGTFYFSLQNEIWLGSIRACQEIRNARASVGGICYHVIDRANARQQVFPKHGDYQARKDAFRPS